jgi:assimilatory nitrate reductase catalytic subunit
LLRNEQGKFVPVSWHIALEEFSSRLKRIQAKYGQESVAFISSGQIVTEEMVMLGALAKFGMGIIHGDGNTRQCMATAATAYKESFGFDAPPFTYKDFEESDVLIFVGANPCIAHPILWKRVLDNDHKPDIIVIDPRKTETAVAATQHLGIRPKSDLILFYGIANVLFEQNWIDPVFIRNHTRGAEAFRKFVNRFPLNLVSEHTGLSVETLFGFAENIHQGKRVSIWWTMGVNQSYEGTRLAQALINIALITGNIGKPGTGANSITGQCNAMGSRLFSNTTNLLGGHDFKNPEHREKIAGILNIDQKLIPDQDSLSYYEIIDGIESGKIRSLWIIGTNTAHSWINQKKFKALRKKLESLIVQDMYYSTETAVLADLILPAAGWGEKEGTFINSERRIGRVRKVKKAPGQALSDFNIFRLVAEYWGCGDMFDDWETPEKVFKVMKKVSAGQPCDISGIRNYEMLDAAGGIQWPFTSGTSDCNERRLFEDGHFFHPDGKAKIIFEDPKSMPECPDKDYPLFLLTGRGTSAQWHTQTRTGKSEILKKLYPEVIYAEINSEDAAALQIDTNDEVLVSSRRSSIHVRAFVTSTVNKGHIFIPMHYHTTNELTPDSFDPYSKQPSYKASAVKIEKLTS